MNRKYTLVLFVLLSCAMWSKAQVPLDQKSYADSLNNSLKLNTSDSIKARTYFLLSYYYITINQVKKSKLCLNKGSALGKRYPYLRAVSYFYESIVYLELDMERSRLAALTCDKLLSVYSDKEAYLFRARALHNTAIIEQRKDNIKGMVDITLNKTIPLTEKSGDKLKLANFYSQLAMVFTNIRERNKAETYYNLAIKIAKDKSANSPVLLNAYVSAALNYNYLRKFPQSKAMLDKAKAILIHYPKSNLLADYYFSEGNYYHGQRQFKAALNSYDMGIAAARALKQTYMVNSLLLQKYASLTYLKDYKAAQFILDSVMKDSDFMSSANNRKAIFKEQARNNLSLGNVKTAYQWLDRQLKITDSLYQSKRNEEINALEAKFRSAENRKRISDLTAANEKVNLEAKNRLLMNWLLGTVSLFLTIILVAGYFFFQKNRKLKELNYQQELKYIDQQHQVKLTRAMIHGQDEERKRVARDLHDGLGGMLSAVKINLSGYAAKSHSEDDQELGLITSRLDSAITELRAIAGNMMPASLLQLGLKVSLKDLCESFISDNLNIDFQCIGLTDNIPVDKQVTIYRIVQELLNNVVRHARAKNVLLQCSRYDDSFMITIEDDGVGFDPECLNEKTGMGMTNIKARVAYLNGKFEIMSSDGKGTSINIEVNICT
ncbi:sensor histidine kinase [Pedobacter sp. MR22-3]|uniref:tetratricopeptide repeat-containing sensor histidine kinase n=1 Tax=Pedobacter sp. MR22-3 TaxID=2994552 RepID=UPI0022474FF0|nr:sensor histidine kinase [Pedobacter sp. MR22-3]MCX2584412.1 sensor histidine kinase [Pedobacter sp. MR22-3]